MENNQNTSTRLTNSSTAEAHVLQTDLISDNGVRLLDAIDDLRRLGIDKDIPLPQIVVVGSQSAGKSSVLEAISGIAFPVNDGQCTTFASEIRLRRAKEETVAVNIVSRVPGQPGAEKLQPLDTSTDMTSTSGMNITWDRMPRIIDRAADAMNNGHGQKFCDDMLRIEVSGPTQDHLSLIDLPGMFHVLKPGQDPAAPERVKNTVERYMKEKRSIILAVVSAKDDFSNQEILKTVERIDPSGIRTMGIITGIDMTSEGSMRESDYIALARNELVPLALGWHVVRNLSFKDRKTANPDRDAMECEFFARREAWRSVLEQDRGAPQLKKKLSQTLLTHIGRELGSVIIALNQKITDNDKILEQLGPQRSTMFEKRVYLTQLGAGHQALTKAALDGAYDDPFFASAAHCLRAKVVEESDIFEKAMADGHRWEFWTLSDYTWVLKGTPSIGMEQSNDGFMVPYKIREHHYLAKVDEILQRYRGQELQGHFDPRLIAVLFKDQSCRWKDIATDAVKKIVKILKTFLEEVTVHLVEARRAQLLLQHSLLPALGAREQTITRKLDELIKPFQKSLPRTHNPQFRQTFARLEKAMLEAKSENDVPGVVLRDPVACQKLALSLRSYYDIARATFVDNVVSLGVELCLLDGLADIFAPSSISNMTDQQVDEIASEFPDDAVKRSKAQIDLKKLRAGRDICREYDRHDDHAHLVESDPQIPKEQPTLFSTTKYESVFGDMGTPSQSPARHPRSSRSASSDRRAVKTPATTHTSGSTDSEAAKDHNHLGIPGTSTGSAGFSGYVTKSSNGFTFGAPSSFGSKLDPKSGHGTSPSGSGGLFGSTNLSDGPNGSTSARAGGFGGFGSGNGFAAAAAPQFQ